MIDLSDTSTWPPKVLELLASTARETRREKSTELAAHLDGSHRHRSLTCSVYKQTRETLEALLLDFEIRAFHCTRLLDPESVKRNGLEILSPVTAKLRLLDSLRQAGVAENLLASAAQAFDNCENTGEFEHRQGMLWFALNKEMIDGSGCADLLQHFGGEIARHALDSLADKLFPVLASIGIPCVVEARLPIRDAQPHHLTALADEFIRLSWGRFLGERQDARDCDMMIRRPIEPDRILKVWKRPVRRR